MPALEKAVALVLDGVAVVHLIATPVVPYLVSRLPAGVKDMTGRVALGVVLLGTAAAARWGATNVREPRGGLEMLWFALPVLLLVLGFHALYWTRDPATRLRLGGLVALAVLVLAARVGLFVIDALGAG